MLSVSTSPNQVDMNEPEHSSSSVDSANDVDIEDDNNEDDDDEDDDDEDDGTDSGQGRLQTDVKEVTEPHDKDENPSTVPVGTIAVEDKPTNRPSKTKSKAKKCRRMKTVKVRMSRGNTTLKKHDLRNLTDFEPTLCFACVLAHSNMNANLGHQADAQVQTDVSLETQSSLNQQAGQALAKAVALMQSLSVERFSWRRILGLLDSKASQQGTPFGVYKWSTRRKQLPANVKSNTDASDPSLFTPRRMGAKSLEVQGQNLLQGSHFPNRGVLSIGKQQQLESQGHHHIWGRIRTNISVTPGEEAMLAARGMNRKRITKNVTERSQQRDADTRRSCPLSSRLYPHSDSEHDYGGTSAGLVCKAAQRHDHLCANCKSVLTGLSDVVWQHDGCERRSRLGYLLEGQQAIHPHNISPYNTCSPTPSLPSTSSGSLHKGNRGPSRTPGQPWAMTGAASGQYGMDSRKLDEGPRMQPTRRYMGVAQYQKQVSLNTSRASGTKRDLQQTMNIVKLPYLASKGGVMLNGCSPSDMLHDATRTYREYTEAHRFMAPMAPDAPPGTPSSPGPPPHFVSSGHDYLMKTETHGRNDLPQYSASDGRMSEVKQSPAEDYLPDSHTDHPPPCVSPSSSSSSSPAPSSRRSSVSETTLRLPLIDETYQLTPR